jgi:Phosphotransferase enzyme family
MSLWPPPRLAGERAERLRERHARTLDPAQLRAEIDGAVDAGHVDHLAIDRLETRPVDIKPDRFVVFVDIDDGRRGRVELVAKGYDDDRGRRIAHNHRLLWDGGLGDGADVRTSRPWGVVASLGIALSERLPGEPPAILDIAGARRAGQAAARLHACDGGLAPAFTLEAALDNAERHARRIAKRAPDLAAGAVAIAHRARAAGETVARGAEPRPIHGDLWLDSVLLDGERTFLFDWDISCRFDPAWDVGYFVAQQRRLGLEAGVETGAVRATFLAAYAEAAGTGAAFAARAAFYEALTYLHKTIAVPRTAWDPMVPALLELADDGMAALA